VTSDAVEQIVGRERRGRVSHDNWSGDAFVKSRRRVNSTVIPLRFKTGTQQRSVVIVLGGQSIGFARAAALGFNVVLESYLRRPRALVRCGKPATMQGGITSR